MKYFFTLLLSFHFFIIDAIPTKLDYAQFEKEWTQFLEKNKKPASLDEEYKLIDDFAHTQLHRMRSSIDDVDRSKKYTPYHENKVTLKDGTEMSASYLTFNWKKGERYHDIIASQAPKSCNIHNFWQMIWEHHIDQVVMLTELKDIIPEKELCYPYFPCGPSPYLKLKNGMTITLIEEKWLLEKHHENIQIRKFLVQKKDEVRMIKHYWYHNWIDHTVPTQDVTIRTLIQEVMRDKKDSKAPLLVHCAGGIGRSGIFIATYHLSERKAHLAQKIKLLDFVAQLRWQRVKLVSRPQAYVFCSEFYKSLK